MSDRDKLGRFLPGNQASPGRPKGAVDKYRLADKHVMRQLIEEGHDEFIERVFRLDDAKFCSVYLAACEYVMPKLSRTESIIQSESEVAVKWEEIPLKERRTLVQALAIADFEGKLG